MAYVSTTITIDEAGGTSSLTILFDGVPGTVHTFTNSTKRFGATALSAPAQMSLSGHRKALDALRVWSDGTEALFGELVPPLQPSHKINGPDLTRGDAKPLGVALRIDGVKLVDVDWTEAGSIITVKSRPALDLDISGYRLFLASHAAMLVAVDDYLAGK